MIEKLNAIGGQAVRDAEAASSLEALEGVRVSVLGKKGALSEVLKGLGAVSAEERPKIDLNPILNFVIEHAKVYQPVELKEAICEDPDDDKFFACALASGSQVIVSGDKHLLKVSGYQGIEVLKPREFLDRFLTEG